MSVRPYRNDDLLAVLAIWLEASLVAHRFLPDEFFDEEAREIETRWLPIAETFVYESQSGLEGFLALIGSEVGAIFVQPDAQGRGIGRALMDEAASRQPELVLSVFEENSLGRGFYAAYGFREIGRTTCERTGHPQLRLRYSHRPDDPGRVL